MEARRPGVGLRVDAGRAQSCTRPLAPTWQLRLTPGLVGAGGAEPPGHKVQLREAEALCSQNAQALHGPPPSAGDPWDVP